ncbi:baculoviral IAP repeat-containing protein 5 isoform X1 [Anolis carolinensis]|nr:PREDICTED: baculoviral IAP repeat-containing protein 5 isoform X1 [Anolis carolinensis]|eukprot:XP_008102410.1 PREDICTED: baculoviral IAP repeat-containing protein 5 isoform X1 [Anolis carolinensis]
MLAQTVPPMLEIYLKEHRAATFVDWPFVSDCACTPERMAEAGFIHTPSENAPDVAQCFVCFKELEGWEPEDDPMEEHQRHSPNCAFLRLQKDTAKLTLQELLKLHKERMINLSKKEINLKIIELEKYAANVRNEVSSFR